MGKRQRRQRTNAIVMMIYLVFPDSDIYCTIVQLFGIIVKMFWEATGIRDIIIIFDLSQNKYFMLYFPHLCTKILQRR